MLEKITKVAREKEINKLQELTKKAFFDTAEEIINEPIYQLNDKFWVQINGPLHQELCLVIENCLHILKNGFNSQAFEDEEFIDHF